MRFEHVFHDAAIGLASGLAATVPMTVVMESVRYALLDSRPERFPPRQVLRGVLKRVGLNKFDEPAMKSMTAAAHLGFGGAAGAVYGGSVGSLLNGYAPSSAAKAAATGAGFGLLVWLTSYFGWLPAIGIVQPQGDHPIRKNIILAISHLAWGCSVGLIFHHMRNGESN